MKKNSKERLFEVMSRLDKTFKPKLNEDVEIGAEVSPEEPVAALPSSEETQEEKTPEEKLEELTAKVDELYAILHGEEETSTEEIPAEETGENLQEWNFDKKKGEKKEEKPKDKTQFNFDKKEDKESKEHEDAETPAEEKKEHKEKKELKEVENNDGKKVPVATWDKAKTGK
jgi:hypothetical protein